MDTNACIFKWTLICSIELSFNNNNRNRINTNIRPIRNWIVPHSETNINNDPCLTNHYQYLQIHLNRNIFDRTFKTCGFGNLILVRNNKTGRVLIDKLSCPEAVLHAERLLYLTLKQMTQTKNNFTTTPLHAVIIRWGNWNPLTIFRQCLKLTLLFPSDVFI